MNKVPYIDPNRSKTVFQKIMERVAKFRPATWCLVNIGPKIDPFLMRVSNGRLKLAPSSSTVILYNRGAKSGILRKIPVIYFSHEEDVILIASKGGADKHPAWLYNIKANPEIELWVGRAGGAYTARIASLEEKEALWPLAVKFYSGFSDYQKRAGNRDIQVVICVSA